MNALTTTIEDMAYSMRQAHARILSPEVRALGFRKASHGVSHPTMQALVDQYINACCIEPEDLSSMCAEVHAFGTLTDEIDRWTWGRPVASDASCAVTLTWDDTFHAPGDGARFHVDSAEALEVIHTTWTEALEVVRAIEAGGDVYTATVDALCAL